MKWLGKFFWWLAKEIFSGLIMGIFISVGAAIVFAVIWHYYGDIILQYFGG